MLGTDVDSTVFRKLNELAYRTSYSHRGSYYTLDEIAQFDRKGLWSLRSVWFSKYGTLLATVKALVAACEAGYYVDELEDVVQVDVKAPLLKLVREKRLAREQVFGRYLYLATDVSTRKQQLSARQVHEASPSTLGWVGGVRVLPVELKAAIVLFYSLLDEKQRRLYAGVEAMKLGHGGDQQIAELLGMDPSTVARGRRELLMRDVELDGVRRKGGGRRAVQKKARSHRQDRRTHEARHRGRSDDGSEMDAADHRQDCLRAKKPRCERQQQNRRSTAQTARLLVAGEPQEAVRCHVRRSRYPIRVYRRTARAFCRSWSSHHQRRHEETGAGGIIQKRRAGLEPRADSRQRP